MAYEGTIFALPVQCYGSFVAIIEEALQEYHPAAHRAVQSYCRGTGVVRGTDRWHRTTTVNFHRLIQFLKIEVLPIHSDPVF